MNVLQTILQILGLSVPNLLHYKGLSVWYILYIITLVTCIVFVYFWELNVRIHSYYQKILKTTVALESTSLTTMTIANVFSIISSVFLRRKQRITLIRELRIVKREFEEKFGCTYNNKKTLSLLFCLIHVVVVLYIIVDGTICQNTFGVRQLVSFLLTYYHIYMISLNVLQICTYATFIKGEFNCLNDMIYSTTLKAIKKHGDYETNRTNLTNMRYFLKTFDKLCDMVELVSKCFGLQIVFIVCISLVVIINGFNTSFKFLLSKATAPKMENMPYIVFANVWCSFMFVVS